MYAYLLFSIKNPEYLPNIRSFITSASSLLPPGYSSAPSIVQPSDKVLLCYWSAPYVSLVGDVNPGHVSSSDKGTFLCSNYSGRGLLGLTGGIKHISRVEGGRLSFDQSPGGVASWAWIAPDANTAMAWSTIPPAITTFVAKNRDGFCVAGNRPRLTHAASVLSKGYRPEIDYLPKYIAAGYAVDGLSPFQSTRALPPGASVLLRAGAYTFAEHPTPPLEPIPQDCPLTEKAAALADILRDACWPAERVTSGIFMSGGKDSRTVIAALSGVGAKSLSAFNFGNDSTGEGAVARETATAVGAGFEHRDQGLVTDPLNALAHALQCSDGLGPSFSAQYTYRYDLSFTSDRSNFHGHGHLLRGGSQRTMSRDPKLLDRAMHDAIISPLATASAADTTARAIDSYLRDRLPHLAKEPLDVHFYPNRDFRLGLFSTPSSLDLTSKALMCYPLLDERVAQFAAALFAFDRLSERVVFGAIKKLAPSIANTPLFGEAWRFDRFPHEMKFVDSDHNYRDGLESRQPMELNKLVQFTNNKRAFQMDADQIASNARRQKAAQLVLDSHVWPDIKSCIQPGMYAELLLWALGRPNDQSSKHPNERFVTGAFIDRMALAAAIYEVRW